jgi:hypothetical protein
MVLFYSYTVAVMARDAAGLQSKVVKSAPILVDATPPEGVVCSHFQNPNTIAMSVETESALHALHVGHVTMDDVNRGRVVRVEVKGTKLHPSALGVVRLQQLHVPLVFRFPPTGGAVAHLDLLTPDTGALLLEVEVEVVPGATITSHLYRCQTTVLSPDQAVTLHQTSLSSVSVCARIRDSESGVKTMMVGVGTTSGGLQVAPWTHVTHAGHMTLPVHVQQSPPLFATVVTQNHACQWSRFVSQPVTFDLTPPQLSNLTLTLNYQGESQSAIVMQAAWTGEDLESGLELCSCILGKIVYLPSLFFCLSSVSSVTFVLFIFLRVW